MKKRLQVSVRKESGHYQRIIYLVFQNIGDELLPQADYFLKVTEGSKTVNYDDCHVFGPLNPGELEEHKIRGTLNQGFVTQKISVKTMGEVYELSVNMFT
ncbi:MAG: hypothetical protein AAF527_00100 [Pseudomonadota bacterium]